MTLKYKVVHQQTRGADNQLKDIYYARACKRRLADLDTVAAKLAKQSTLSEADIYATLVGLTHLIPDLLLNNQSVSLGDLGTLSLHFSSETKDSADDVNKRCIKDLRVRFRASTKLKKMLRLPVFEKNKD